MAEVDDGYDSYYGNRLWQLLPSVFRALDSDDADVSGPLEELVARIGAQVAVVRRSIDRLWADQSIETCDDWVIPYIGDLLGTNLVNGDPRGQRLDVAKTIHYRRRKGTLAVLEEIARDVTGWDAHVVEAFRRLSRTRHNLDPPVGAGPLGAALPTPCPSSTAVAQTPDPSELLQHERLVGPLTGTLAGGFADLRAAHGANLADSPFDEYFHTADLRLGQGAVGLYAIPKLLVFLWRLQSFAVIDGTPVQVSGCSNTYVFDPTGRNVPLFLPPLLPEPDDWADVWSSANEWQVPGPLTSSLQRAIADPHPGLPSHAPYPYAANLPDFCAASAGAPLEPVTIEVCWPEAGQFKLESPPSEPLTVSYQYGFPAPIGAAPYDRTLLGNPPTLVDPEHPVSGGRGFDTALTRSGGQGTVTIQDSLTYAGVIDVGSTATPIGSLLVRAGADVRPVVRLPAPGQASDPPTAWVFTGGGVNSELILDGLFVSGGDIVLRGAFATVRLTGCTVDPGTVDETSDAFAASVDGRQLAPARIWIEADPTAQAGASGAIEQLLVDHCVLGPVRTRGGGAVESLKISDSIVQGIAPISAGQIVLSQVYDPELLAKALGSADPLSEQLVAAMSTTAQQAIHAYTDGEPSDAALEAILGGLNGLIGGPARLDTVGSFTGVPMDPELSATLASGAAADIATVNCALLEAAYPAALSAGALALSQGTVTLTSVSVIGRAFVHRLQASDTILADFTVAQDSQDGCVRFCAVSAGSSVPRQYRSVTIATDAGLFTSSAFGDPGYGQLLGSADRAVVPRTTGLTVTSGAESGSEMGAFSSQLAPIKERGLLIKYGEYMPLGLTPVVVHVT